MTYISKIHAKVSVINHDIIEVKDISHLHKGHKGYHHLNQPSHIHVFIVSNQFNNMKIIERHRLINSLLLNEIHNELHSLSIHALTPAEHTQQLKNTKE